MKKKKKRKSNNNNNEKGCSSIESKKKKKKKELVSSSWSNLPNDLILNIFNRLDHKYLLWVVALVCRSWQLACWDVLFWREGYPNHDVENLDLTCLVLLCDDGDIGFAISRVINSLFDYHGDLLEDVGRNLYALTFPRSRISDDHLHYVSQRTFKLQRIFLEMHSITSKGFSRAIRNWRELEMIHVESVNGNDYTHIIQEIGINCKKLVLLSIDSFTGSNIPFCLDEYNSQVIADNLCSLKGLAVMDCYINKLGVLTIMKKSRQLVMLAFGGCIRALEEIKLARSRRPSNAKPFTSIPEPLTVILEKCKGSVNEWYVDQLPGKHNIRSVVNDLWKEAPDASVTANT